MVGELASALERVGALEQQNQSESINSRAHSLPPPINKQPSTGPQNRTRSPPPRRNTVQFAAPRADQPNDKGAIGFYNWQSTKMTVKERISFLFNRYVSMNRQGLKK